MLILGVEPRITAYKTIVITVSLYELHFGSGFRVKDYYMKPYNMYYEIIFKLFFNNITKFITQNL